MNIKELNERAKVNQKNALEEAIAEIEKRMTWRANNGFNNFKVATHDEDCYYTIREWMIKPLKEYFENEGYKVEVEKIKTLTRGIQKLLGIYEPEYLMIIRWEMV